MHDLMIAIATAAAIVLIHFAYVDFRFRYREGAAWFWLLNPAPPLMWVGRITGVAALLAALVGPFIGMGAIFGWVVGGLVVLHLISLALLEVLEPR